MNPKIFIFLLFITLNSCTDFNVKTSSKLKKALREAKAGDVINLADGIYTDIRAFSPANNGTKNKPITLRGNKKAIISNPNLDGIYLDKKKWWILEGFSVFNVTRAVILDYSSNILIENLDISYTNNAAIKIRYNSTSNTVQNSTISYTGRSDPANGEGIYIGASINFWQERGPDCSSDNQVLSNHFGPYVSSESIDIKEGVERILVQDNVIDGKGMQDDNYSNTWISVKGSKCVIKGNYGKSSVLDGFTARTVKNDVVKSGCLNQFINNTCSELGQLINKHGELVKGQCVNLSWIRKCYNEDTNNTIV